VSVKKLASILGTLLLGLDNKGVVDVDRDKGVVDVDNSNGGADGLVDDSIEGADGLFDELGAK
jgi:hypothetical protein